MANTTVKVLRLVFGKETSHQIAYNTNNDA